MSFTAQTVPGAPASGTTGTTQPPGATAAPGGNGQPTLEQRIDTAVAEAAQIVATFNPGIAALMAAGVSMEPVFSGFIHMIGLVFKHHATKATTGK